MMKSFLTIGALFGAGLLVACGAQGSGDVPEVNGGEESNNARAENNDSGGEAVEGETAWLTDFHGALARAEETGRPVLINITGSDWCPPCMMLKENVFDSNEFKDYARDNLVLLEVDFPRQTELPEEQRRHNEAIAQLYRAEAFPTLVIADAEANEQKRMVGAEAASPDAFIRWIEE